METTNLSKIRRDKMLKTIDEIKKNIVDEETLNNLEMIENELTKKKYGLIWEEHEERVDKELETQIPTFEEIKDKEIVSNSDDKFNFLLEGDNLHSLYLLEKTHKGKIDVIYIDPPYNTGNKDFIYDDTYIEIEDSYKHSKWLSFMSKRLNIAKNLLKSDGIVFISIDDNELYQLKLLCDEIFGDNNYFTTIAIEMSKTQGMKVKAAQAGQIVKNHEYILCYSKKIENSVVNRQCLYDLNVSFDTHFNKIIKNENDKFYLFDLSSYIKENDLEIWNLFEKYNFIKNGKIISNTISLAIDINEKIRDYFFNKISNILYQEMACSITVPDEYIKKLKQGEIVAYDKYILCMSSGGIIRQYRNFAETLNYNDEYFSSLSRVTIRGTLWKGFYSDMMNIAKEGNIEFKNGKKPIRLIKQLLKWINRTNAIILDFFAGSGSTAQAVLELNKEDGGNRKFILCTNNENNICENITYKRIKNVINGYGKYASLKANLKYYHCTYIPRMNSETENLYNNLLINIKNLIQLENGIEIDDNKTRVYLDEDEFDKFSSNQKELDICEKVYISSDILLTTEQEEILKKNNIEMYIIPEYYFEDEIMEIM